MAVMNWIILLALSAPYLEVQSQKDKNFVKAANCFSINLMKKIKTDDGNLIMSGLSAHILMNMLGAGARGSTADELNVALQNTANDLNGEEVKTETGKAIQRLTSDQNVTLEIANAIYLEKTYPVNQSYKKTVNEYFLAKAENVDFKNNPHGATEAINRWVDEKTKSLIKKLYDEDLEPSTKLVALNAIYFKGDWMYKFQTTKTKTQPFYNGGDVNTVKMVPLMNQQRKFSYKDDKNMKVQVLRMDYKGGKLSYVVVLPYKGTDDFEKGISCDTLGGLMEQMRSSLVNVSLPKQDLKSSLELVKPLKDLGASQIFGSPDLSGIGPGALQVSDVLQKARILVHEEGSEAAAVTGGGVRTTSVVEPPEVMQFLADRPFHYFIMEKENGLILFAGKVNKL